MMQNVRNPWRPIASIGPFVICVIAGRQGDKDGIEPSDPAFQVFANLPPAPQSVETPKAAEPPKSVETAQNKAVEPPGKETGTRLVFGLVAMV
jgi:hypothetical protein